MNKVILDETVWSKLSNVEEAELCDEFGQSVGHFLSKELYHHLLYNWANAQITDEELVHRRQQPGGRGLEEIWARLRQN